MWETHKSRHFSSADNQIHDLFGEGNDDPAGDCHDPISSLAGIVSFHGHTHLHDAEADKNHSNRSYQPENKIGQLIHDCYRICLVCQDCQADYESQHETHPYAHHQFLFPVQVVLAHFVSFPFLCSIILLRVLLPI